MPKVKSDGKIIKPASTAITVFSTPVMMEVCTKLSSFLTKLESVIIVAKPSERAKKTCPKTSIKSFAFILEKSGLR